MSRDAYGPSTSYTGTGTLAVYTFDFKIEDASQLLVIVVNNVGVETSRYKGNASSNFTSLIFDPKNGGGTLTLLAPLASGAKLIIQEANDAPTQPFKFRTQASFTLDRVEAALDFLCGAIQRNAYRAARAVSMHESETGFNPQLPIGLASATNLIPVVTGGAFAPVASWVKVPDIAAAIAAGVTAASAAATATASAGSAASYVTQAAASATSAGTAATQANTFASQAATSAGVATSMAAAAANSASGIAAQLVTAANSATAAQSSNVQAQDWANQAFNARTDCIALRNYCSSLANSAAISEHNAYVSAQGAESARVTCVGAASAAGDSANQAAGSATSAAASAAAAAAAAGGGAPSVIGSTGSPVTTDGLSSIPFTSTFFTTIMFLAGQGGTPRTVTASPMIQSAGAVGQRLMIIGASDIAWVKITDSFQLRLKGEGELYFYANTVAEFIWTGTQWSQI